MLARQLNNNQWGSRKRYRTPRGIKTTKLFDILPAHRPVTPKQQNRFAFAADDTGSPIIHYAGDLELLKRPCVAIIGTRNISENGAKRARRLARELVEAGVVVVSGLAMGVDTEAHQATHQAGGRMIGVIGTPLDKATPAASAPLQEEIYNNHLLISPFEIGSAVHRSNFPQRNKIMAAISDATVVIEASETSGTIHQAAECERLGRWLFITKSLHNSSMQTEKQTWVRFAKGKKAKILIKTQDILNTIQH